MNRKAINKLCTVSETAQMINDKKILLLAGHEKVLSQLPKGKWIGGTSPYFMDIEGGTFSKEKIFVTDLSDFQKNYRISAYQTSEMQKLLSDRYSNGFTYLLIPAFSEIHQHFALKAESMPGLYDTPLVGWITGIDLEEPGAAPKAVNGQTGELLDNKALALHIELPEGNMAQLEILNIFSQGSGDVITFDNDGFQCITCNVNGTETKFADYLLQNKIDTRLPLVADYAGAQINISIQEIDETNKKVKFYAPVRKGTEYRLSQPMNDYVTEFLKIVPEDNTSNNIVMSCNCILNYLYSSLENKKTGGMTGPVTFGEIAYVLVNQTMVYLSVV